MVSALYYFSAALQQTVPPGGVAVCPLSTVQYTCVTDTVMNWRETGSSATTTYTILPTTPDRSKVNDTGMAGSFITVLTDMQWHHTHINSYYRQCQPGR